MNIRRIAPLVFAALCVGLSTFVLRGQIEAHPKPPPAPAPDDSSPAGGPTLSGLPVNPTVWHITVGPTRQAVVAAIGGQLSAIRAGDADRAWSYQSRSLRRNFYSAQDFTATISGKFPEFGHAEEAAFGPVWVDARADHADVIVTVLGQNGRLARGYYWLVREDGGYKVAAVEGGRSGSGR